MWSLGAVLMMRCRLIPSLVLPPLDIVSWPRLMDFLSLDFFFSLIFLCFMSWSFHPLILSVPWCCSLPSMDGSCPLNLSLDIVSLDAISWLGTSCVFDRLRHLFFSKSLGFGHSLLTYIRKVQIAYVLHPYTSDPTSSLNTRNNTQQQHLSRRTLKETSTKTYTTSLHTPVHFWQDSCKATWPDNRYFTQVQ